MEQLTQLQLKAHAIEVEVRHIKEQLDAVHRVVIGDGSKVSLLTRFDLLTQALGKVSEQLAHMSQKQDMLKADIAHVKQYQTTVRERAKGVAWALEAAKLLGTGSTAALILKLLS